MIGQLNRMLYGPVPPGVEMGEGSRWALLPLAGCAVVLVVLGLTIPPPVDALLARIAEIVAP
jgi:hypothetical protein